MNTDLHGLDMQEKNGVAPVEMKGGILSFSYLCKSVFICGCLPLLFLGGCWDPFHILHPAPPASQPFHIDDPSGVPGSLGSPGSADPKAGAVAVRVDVWLIGVPRGSVSANEAFWRRVDETAFAPGKYDALFSNGLRVGRARQEDWGYFKNLLDGYPAKFTRNGIAVRDEQAFEIPVHEGIETQTLSLVEADGRLRLTTFQNCDNALKLGVAPAPRRADAARVTLTPVVRTHDEKLGLSPEGRLQRTSPTFLYDLNLATEVPIGQFLVISPSTDAALNTSIGRNFLLMDGPAEQLELVLLIVPAVGTAPATQAAP